MIRFKKPISIVTAGLLVSGILFASSVDASQAVKKLDANYRNIKIVYNGQSATIDPKTEPFIANGTTYVPLRMMSDLFNKTVNWNGATNTITAADKTPQISSSVVTALNAQITEKNTKISQLEAEIKRLNTEISTLKTQQSKVADLDDLEEQLNDDYEDYRNIDDVEIKLSGNKNDITVRIDVDAADWKNLSNSKREDFLQDIADDILADYKDADIEGTIRDTDNNKTLTSFKTDSRDVVKLEDETIDIDDLEDNLNRDHDDNNDIDDIKIYLTGDEDDIKLNIKVDEADWTNLSSSKQRNFIEAIVSDILDEYEDCDIEGTINANNSSNKKLNDFDADSDGDVTIS